MTPTFLEKFSNQDIQNLIQYGHIVPNIDAYSNLNLISNLNTISSSIISFPLENLIYDQNYISTFYDSTFTEFTTQATPSLNTPESPLQINLQNQLSNTQTELEQTKLALTNVIAQNSQVGSLQSYVSASRDVVVGLRIQLGEGSSSADFESSYPWRPISSLPYLSSYTSSNG